MEKKQAIAIGIGLQTQVLKTCPVHQKLYFDDEVNPAGAFALAVELVRHHRQYVEEFHDDEHELTDLLSDTLGATPMCCPDCGSAALSRAMCDRGGFVESALEIR